MAAASMAVVASMVAAATMEVKDMKTAAQNDGRSAMVEGVAVAMMAEALLKCGRRLQQ